ncbi:MAG TPA: aminoglycoside phosphotransferase family protein, partial [Deltaproteobacteria bacterium]|nr:aminoglycoside phosphotransferase family protein [Deltaproteobacteria bacterium]
MDTRNSTLMEEEALRAAALWGLDAAVIRHDLAISGSPERSEFRCVVGGAGRQPVLLESIRRQDLGHKQAVIDRLDFLARQGLPYVHPYKRTTDGRHIPSIEGRFWQASPYVPGAPLDRTRYALDGWRGETMADFLIRLREASQTLPEELSTPVFSILDYLDALTGTMEKREPLLHERLAPVTAFLRERLAPVHDSLPAAFCHGDFHPLNVIWSKTGIRGVIDWEFSGTKPECYDAALLIGCLGMESPDNLDGAMVMEFIRHLRAARVLSDASWRVLVEMIIAIRFGWLSEWLRKRDTEM